jgi:hypothetical protein
MSERQVNVTYSDGFRIGVGVACAWFVMWLVYRAVYYGLAYYQNQTWQGPG